MKSLSYVVNSSNICEIIFFNKNKNSFSPEAAEELNLILDEINQNKKIKGLLFLSNNKSFFCVGGDLKYYSSLPDKQPGINANIKITNILNKLQRLPIPTAVCVDGLCIGGGVELISCFDYVVSTNRSLFSLWQRKIGLSFGWGGGKRLLERFSNQSLIKKFLDASSVTSYEALELNLIDKLVPDFKLKESAISWLLRSAKLPMQPLSLAKSGKLLASEQDSFEALWLQEDHKSALTKFNKK